VVSFSVFACSIRLNCCELQPAIQKTAMVNQAITRPGNKVIKCRLGRFTSMSPALFTSSPPHLVTWSGEGTVPIGPCGGKELYRLFRRTQEFFQTGIQGLRLGLGGCQAEISGGPVHDPQAAVGLLGQALDFARAAVVEDEI